MVFFRRQDKFLKSVYAQTVKIRPLSASVEQFKDSVAEALDYARYMQLWSRNFPDCTVYTYEETANDALRFFLRNVLQIGDTNSFDALDLRVNSTLARDLVEYKRELNKATSFVDQRMSHFVCAELQRVIAGDGRYQRLSLARSQGEAAARGRARQCASQPDLRHEAVSPSSKYGDMDALSRTSSERAKELRQRHERIKRTARYRFERATLLLRQITRKLRAMIKVSRANIAEPSARARDAPSHSANSAHREVRGEELLVAAA